MSSNISGSDNFDSSYLPNDVTLLVEYTTRLYNGTITLNESLENFDEIVIIGQHYTALQKKQARIATGMITYGDIYTIWDNQTGYANWTITDSTTLTFVNEKISWIRSSYGVGRKG